MDQMTLLWVMAGAVIVSAIALVIQACMLFGMYKASQALRERILTVLPKLEELVETSRDVIEEGRMTVVEIRQKSNLILDSGQKQMRQLESILSDAAERSNRQMAYAEAVVQEALGRVEDTVQLVHQGVLKPIRGLSGIAAGVSAALQYLLSRRPTPGGATLDEEMFI
ncbi:MAG: hypothetical protein WDO18_08365 [Acidobacteriota bacterium]